MAPRKILHFDLDAFFCSVEELLDPKLRGKAFVVGGRPDGRGVVASASYEARKYGIRSAMPTAQALRLAPQLVILNGRHGVYGQHSKQVMDHLRLAAPMMQQISIDEAFLDISAAREEGYPLAIRLQAEILQKYALPTSWGIATNKLVAKIATELAKPGGVMDVPPGTEKEFLSPLPVEMLWGVGPKTRQRLNQIGIQTIGELSQVSADKLRSYFGTVGLDLASRASGEDASEVREGREPRSMSAEQTFAKDISDPRQLHRALLQMSEEVGRRLRAEGLGGRTVRLKIRWPDFETHTRQVKLSQPTDHDGEIYKTAQGLLAGIWSAGKAVRLLGVGVTDLEIPWRQLSLFEEGWVQDPSLQDALDEIRTRFGPRAVRRAGGISVKKKPDEKLDP